MHWLDWLIVTVPVGLVAATAVYARRYLKSVADFMAGGRHAGRYLLSTAKSEMGAGAVAYVSMFEAFGKGGFSLRWWGQLSVPVTLVVAISGFVIYRYRETRALTIAQFFEERYSRRFRLFTGILALFAGLLNFGIMPVIGARFMVYFLDLPLTLHVMSFQVKTYLVLMAFNLSVCTLTTVAGGQITVILTDCLQGMFSQVFYVCIALSLLVAFNWAQTRGVLLNHPVGESVVNPFDSFSVKDWNIWYVLMGLFGGVYGTMAWQNQHAFNSSAATPHEARMGNILGQWRGFALGTMMVLLAVCAITYLGTPEGAANVKHSLSRIPDTRTQGQMQLVIALSQILPTGVKGMLVAAVIMGIFGGDGMHLHSWSSIFIQDVVLPLRKRPLTTIEHIKFLRLSAVGVAFVVFCFGAVFRQTEYVAFWFLVTMAIYVGGAGACIIGGLYWSRGTTAGAWTALIVGSAFATCGIIIRQFNANFPLNVVQIGFIANLSAIGSYVVVSLLTCREPYNMDQLLHRGRYAVESGSEAQSSTPARASRRFTFQKLVGIDEHFSPSDRWVSWGIFIWSVFWFAVFVLGSAVYLIHPWSNAAWADYWLWTGIYLPLAIAVFTTVWFTIGCWLDLRLFIRRLAGERNDRNDDGFVQGGPPR